MADIEQQAKHPLPATGPFVDRLIAAFRNRDSADPLCTILLDYGMAALTSQRQAPAAVVPDGFLLVPITPTDDMLDKANDVKVGGHCYYCSQEYATYDDAAGVWAAMLAAAPAPEVK